MKNNSILEKIIAIEKTIGEMRDNLDTMINAIKETEENKLKIKSYVKEKELDCLESSYWQIVRLFESDSKSKDHFLDFTKKRKKNYYT